MRLREILTARILQEFAEEPLAVYLPPILRSCNWQYLSNFTINLSEPPEGWREREKGRRIREVSLWFDSHVREGESRMRQSR